MSEKEPFDAVINELRGVIGEAEETGIWDDLIGECKAAIRVLEAAGKVNKTRAIQGLKNMENIGDFFPNEWSVPLGFEELLSQNKESAKEIRALLESLPDKEERCIGTY